MPKYWVTYGFNVPAYGEIAVEAENDEAVVDEVRRLHKEDNLILDWDTQPDCGCEDYRVVSIEHLPLNIDNEYVSDGFTLEDKS